MSAKRDVARARPSCLCGPSGRGGPASAPTTARRLRSRSISSALPPPPNSGQGHKRRLRPRARLCKPTGEPHPSPCSNALSARASPGFPYPGIPSPHPAHPCDPPRKLPCRNMASTLLFSDNCAISLLPLQLSASGDFRLKDFPPPACSFAFALSCLLQDSGSCAHMCYTCTGFEIQAPGTEPPNRNNEDNHKATHQAPAIISNCF